MIIQDIISLDFETEPIREHKALPKPIGLAVRFADGHCEYYTEDLASRLKWILDSEANLLFHNAKFDLGVMLTHLLPDCDLDWRRIHDTQFLLVLNEPYAKNLQLKDSAERLLGMKPEERDEIVEWLLLHKLEECKAEAKFSGVSVAKAAKALIYLAPKDLVRRYAIGDVVRTYELFRYLHPRVVDEGEMGRAYDLERRILLPLTRLEMRGMRVDVKRLCKAMVELKAGQQEAALRIYDKLHQYADIGSPTLARILHRGKHVTGLGVTAKGNVSTSKDSLENASFVDPELRELIMYWRGCAYVLNNSIEPWLKSAGSGDIIRTSWNQTRGGDGGARTLRFSCAWFMNIANERILRYNLLPDLPKIPSPREFIIPLEGFDKIVCRDWKQQEFRVAAHFEGGQLAAAYEKDPTLDIHTHATKLINEMGHTYSRKKIKVFNLATIYGMGVEKAALQAKVTSAEARILRNLVKRAVPGVVDLGNRVQRVEALRGYVRTYMGAQLTKEPPFRMNNGHMIDFGYKLLNHLIQRSSAEMMKEAIALWHEGGFAEQWPWMLSVHDENNVYAQDNDWREASVDLGRIMNAGGFDVPMLSDLAVGEMWGSLQELNDDFTPKEE